jgi:hypothetical protein
VLDPWIIEEIRRREDAERRQREERERPALEIPKDTPVHSPERERRPPPDDEGGRGVVIVDFRV